MHIMAEFRMFMTLEPLHEHRDEESSAQILALRFLSCHFMGNFYVNNKDKKKSNIEFTSHPVNEQI